MTTSSTTTTTQKDPRISSPDIKVTYPAETKSTTLSSTKPSSTAVDLSKIRAVSELAELKPKKVETTTQQPTAASTAKIPLADALKQHLWLFIGCGVALLAIGFLIGKKQAS